jgi:cyclic beta-1,2-glucan synthetase
MTAADKQTASATLTQAEHRLEQTAHRLAAHHTLTDQPSSTQAKPMIRLHWLGQRLEAIHQYYIQTTTQDLSLSYAAEWLLDNYYIIQQALRQIRQDLPDEYYRQLPSLVGEGPLGELPRVYALARAFVEHEQCQHNLPRLKRFVAAYQSTRPLTMGELWALPIMLRLTFLECLTLALSRLTPQLNHAEISTPDYTHTINDEDIVAHSISSLRQLNGQDWEQFFEELSLVEQKLRQDPADIYGRMDFDSRDQYRKVIEKLAQNSTHNELTITDIVLGLAQQGKQPGEVRKPLYDPLAHVGYYLLANGRDELEGVLNYRPPFWQSMRRTLHAHPTFFYLGSIALLTTLLLGAGGWYAISVGGSLGEVLLTLFLTLIPALTIADSFVNWVVTHTVAPNVLPKLDFEKGVPDDGRTIVVVPALLAQMADVHNLFTQLEMHYLRNPDPNLAYALLTDFADAATQHCPEDELLIQEALSRLQALNEASPQQPFYFFHRQRFWNPAENCWMGWERKRGKLHEFNRWLRGDTNTSFTVQAGQLDQLHDIRYVITLDADTILPRGGAQRLIGTLAHPLNRAQFDPETNPLVHGDVIAGYTILQPRTEVKPTSANQSLFTRVFTGDIGLDLYTRAVSDVYQDLWGEGIYVGKGIYDVDAFERSLDGRIPPNTLLSHDLFEGIHGRAGLVTDIVLYEDYPTHYLTNLYRSHRWIRGDWQLLPWLRPSVPYQDGRIANPLSPISRRKIAHNLRRSLLSPALLLLLLAGWTILPGSPLLWTTIALFTPAVSLVTNSLVALIRRVSGDTWSDVLPPMRDSALRWLLYCAFLPYEAILHLHAILVTLYRLTISRKHLLEWTTAAHTARLFDGRMTAETTLFKMLPGLILVVILILIVYLLNSPGLIFAAPLLIIWAIASEIAHWISRPDPPFHPPHWGGKRGGGPLTAVQEQRLHSLARRTWLFYEQFVGPGDNWLPPDHFQEVPRGVVAHRTSPTNVGLYLISTLAAHDLGYLGSLNLSLRLRSAFAALAKLERYQGHFLNWVDTSGLTSLNPRYVSMVDSGNLAACLLIIKQGCYDLLHQPVWGAERWRGLTDTILLLEESLLPPPPLASPPVGGEEGGATAKALRDHLAALCQRLLDAGDQPNQWPILMNYLMTTGQEELNQHMLNLLAAKTDMPAIPAYAGTVHEWRIYLDRLYEHLRDWQREMDLLLPWLQIRAEPPSLFTRADSPSPSTRGPVVEAWQAVQAALPEGVPTLAQLPSLCQTIRGQLSDLQAHLAPPAVPPSGGDERGERGEYEEARVWCQQLATRLKINCDAAEALVEEYNALAREADDFCREMDFHFLYNQERQVFHIGYNLETGRLDPNYYDLLASEARIGSLVAIAKRDVPVSHWLHLGRPMTQVPEGRLLLSWSGTMFEYLMPYLMMPSYKGTLLHQSCLTAVKHQIRYGQQHNIPWGISESGFYTFDAAQNYQYQAFGVPHLGFKRGLGDDLVITPYASIMALPIQPQAVLDNMDHLLQWQMLGRYGFYEALDFTESHLPLGQRAAVIRSYMAHHQAMIMLALANYLCQDKMISRFHAEPSLQSIELLLQEQIPRQAPLQDPHTDEEMSVMRSTSDHFSITPWLVPTRTPVPLIHYLSNGRFRTLITNNGSGACDWHDIALTRWQPDAVQDNWGCWLYVQDLDIPVYTGTPLWSATPQPIGQAADSLTVEYHPHKATFQHSYQGLAMQTEIVVAVDDDVEIRRYSLTNSSDEPRHLRLTTYGEVVLAPRATDQRHPAFAKLFVESEYLAAANALLFRRRPRAHDEEAHFLVHMLLTEPDLRPTEAYESDRAKFIGREQTARLPQALQNGAWLTGTTGATLDPIMALGQEVVLEPHATVQIATITLAANSRQKALELVTKYHAWSSLDRVFQEARNQAEQALRRLEISSEGLAHLLQLLSLLIYPQGVRRAGTAVLTANRKGQPALWAFGISGDYPILLTHIQDASQTALLAELLTAHIYWRRRGLKIDLVIVNEQETNYGQELQRVIHRLIQRSESDHWLNQRGGIFVLRRDQMDDDHYILLETAARVVLDCAEGKLANQLATLWQEHPIPLPALTATRAPRGNGVRVHEDEEMAATNPLPRPNDLQFDNGWGGFSADGREYLIYLEPGQSTPAPWINVVANENFGFLASESGGGYTWAANSGENRLTTWRNDPVTDEPAEALYIRDEETAEFWSPTPQPAPATAPYLIRHGAGYTNYQHNSHGLKQHLRLFAAPDDPIKIVQLHLENSQGQPRRLTVTFYAEWVLGNDRDQMKPFIVPEYDEEAGFGLLATNYYNVEFSERVAFMATSKRPHGLTADRLEFLGAGGSLRHPAALTRVGLQGRVAAGLDPCVAMQLHIDLAPGASEEVYFLLGQGANREETLALIRKYSDADEVAATWQAVQDTWRDILGTVQVNTPDPAMNLLLNQWLPYQALACRVWGRSALYQSSGAYGFRDQLQDVMALLHTRPDLARAHLLRSARHQFEAGDVLHWWHPPAGRGVRTRITDDLVWLPYVTAHYVNGTGDTAVLDESVPFLKGVPLKPDEEERYGHYQPTDESYSLFEHCCRVLDKATTKGKHGLPLMGAGDWNDGMNRVGIEGDGQSIWLGWFLYKTLMAFADLCQQRCEKVLAGQYRQQAQAYQQALEKNGWDGQWYLRAYYDDGTPLGSAENEECQIDAIAQSWAVLSGAAESERAQMAMQSVRERLIREDDRLLLLFTPPFDQTEKDPGYIKGYLPGIRENGGQYTHAALWTIWALADLGQGETAESLFRLINPIYRADTRAKASHYRVEPYVIAADVYGVPPHVGRGGWTWYTGSSGWMYRLGLERILGLTKTAAGLRIDPRIPPTWPAFTLTYRHQGVTYEIDVDNPEGVSQGIKWIKLNGDMGSENLIPWLEDGNVHYVQVMMGQRD